MNAELRTTTRRGDYLVHAIHDTTRVTHPKTADIVEVNTRYLVIPVANHNPVKECDTMDEAMSFIHRYIGLNE